ncbi:MAG: AAA family ATPase, partial [Armatimonadetes bacterium]|nr:AAA family ATPase [Armatimonadota bacterium]
MILHRLEVLNFGRFASGQWEFSEGINVVQGPNEAGKSTLAEAIAKALLGSRDVSTTAADYREWKTWGREDMFVLRAEFSHRGERWRVTRDFVEGKEILENLHTGERIRTRVRQRLAEMVGLQPDRSEAQYLATAYLRQGEWETVAEAETIKDIVTNVVLLGAGGPNPRKLLQDLRKRRAEHMRGATGRTADKNPGPIALARARVQQLEEEVARLEAEAQKEENARKQLHAAQEELRSVRSKLDQLEKRL